ncbi:MAG: hypothetical protein CMA92_04950 [Euryarchaeota archaeon]|nr:hypothetical protein [Euryarchaeota archaeon]
MIFQNLFLISRFRIDMSEPIFSPDGKFMWSGSEWIPAPPKASQTLNMQDSVIGGDVVHNTVINNDVDAVTTAVITALERLGMVNKNETVSQIEEIIASPIQAELEVGMHVEYFSPTNERWLDRCTITKVNDDGSYDVDVPKSSGIESKHNLLIGENAGNIRRADDSLNKGDRVLVNWKNYGTFFPGRIAEVQPHHTYMIHFDDGDVESGVPPSRIAKQPDSEATQAYVEQISQEEQELIESFKVFDENNTGTIHASKLFEILTQMGDPLEISDVQEMFNEMGISLDSELNYKDLAKIMVQPFEEKSEVIIQDAKIIDGKLHGFVYGHPKLGDTNVSTSDIIKITYDNRATAKVETNNTIYVVGPTGWENRPTDHPFNKPDYSTGQQVKVEWKGSWWDALIRDIQGDNYLIHYVGFDSSWDEWVDSSRIKLP